MTGNVNLHVHIQETPAFYSRVSVSHYGNLFSVPGIICLNLAIHRFPYDMVH